jgi:hypothetical protein
LQQVLQQVLQQLLQLEVGTFKAEIPLQKL